MKLCADSTIVPTPAGYRTHGDLRPGDYVFGPDGLPTRIRAITPKGVADMEVVFKGGEVVKCNGDHLWTVYDRWAQKWKTLDTATLASLPTESDRSRFFIPDSKCLQFDAQKEALPLHPYFLGVWLGDGSSSKPCVAHDVNDCAHIEKLAELGYDVNVTHKMVGNGRSSYFSHQGIGQRLRGLGVFNNKHIPDAYMLASEEDRLELLAGLIDTDGSAEPLTGRVRISTCIQLLAEQYERLAISLGFRAYTVSADTVGYGDYHDGYKTVWQVCFQPDREIPTAIKRKSITRITFAKRRRGIVEIRKAATPEIGQCINVERADGLYLVGRTNVVTHNSVGASVFFPAWIWAQNPDPDNIGHGLNVRPNSWKGPGVRFLSASYAFDLAVNDSANSKRLMEGDWYQRNWGDRFKIRQDSSAKDNFGNDKNGQRISISIEGQLTGKGGDIILIDDPHNVQEAESKRVREGVIKWWQESMPSRLNDQINGAFIVIMQRVHENDLTGHILAKEMGWDHLCLPARYEPDHPRKVISSLGFKDPRTAPGEPLWEDRFPVEALDNLQASMTAYAIAGQYQQRPAPREGGMFKRRHFGIVKAPPALCRRVRKWDLAATAILKNDPDWTVGLRMSVDHNNIYYIEDVQRFRGTPLEVEKAIMTTAMLDRHTTGIILPQDPAQSGKFQAQYLVGKLSGFNVRATPESGSKEQRAEPFAAQVEAGNVKLVEGDWNLTFLEELESFPNGSHDDQVDSAAGAFKALHQTASGPLQGRYGYSNR